MKRVFILAGILLPLLSWSQSPAPTPQNSDSSAQKPDGNRQSVFLTAAPRLGGIALTDAVSPMKHGNGRSIVQQHIVDFGIPVYENFTSKHPTFIKVGFRYENLIVPNHPALGNGSFNNFMVPLVASYSVTKKFNLTLIGMAAMSSDMKQDFTTGDIQYNAGIRFGWQPNQNLRYGVTLVYVNNYSGKYLLPVPDIEWTINKKWQFSAVVPSRITIKYKLTPNQSLGLTTGYASNVYAINKIGQQSVKQYLSWQQYSGGLLYEVTLSKRWNFNVMAGHSFSQKLETFDQSQKASLDNFSFLSNRKPIYSDHQTSFIAQATINYKF
jgi:hypothetical protein